MAHGLTPKQERFCIEYFGGDGNASEAYRVAYNCENMKETTINRNAFELLQNSKITARLDKLKSKVVKKTIITKEILIDRLNTIGLENDRDRVAAYKQISKILGFDAPTQQEITVIAPFSKYLVDKESDGS